MFAPTGLLPVPTPLRVPEPRVCGPCVTEGPSLPLGPRLGAAGHWARKSRISVRSQHGPWAATVAPDPQGKEWALRRCSGSSGLLRAPLGQTPPLDRWQHAVPP